MNRFSSISCTWKNFMNRQVFGVWNQRFLPAWWEIGYHETLSFNAFISWSSRLWALVFNRAISCLSLPVEDRVTENSNLSIIFIFFAAYHYRASNVIINEDHIREISTKCSIVNYYSSLRAFIGWEVGTLDAERFLGERLLRCKIHSSPSIDWVGNVVLENLLFIAFSTFMTSCNESCIWNTWYYIPLYPQINAVTLDASHNSSRLNHWWSGLIDEVILNDRYLVANNVNIGRCWDVDTVLSKIPYGIIDKIDVLWVINLYCNTETMMQGHVGDARLESGVVFKSKCSF